MARNDVAAFALVVAVAALGVSALMVVGFLTRGSPALTGATVGEQGIALTADQAVSVGEVYLVKELSSGQFCGGEVQVIKAEKVGQAGEHTFYTSSQSLYPGECFIVSSQAGQACGKEAVLVSELDSGACSQMFS